MTLIGDSVVVALLASAAFFVALSVGLLLRYRQISQRISASSDLGRDLWQALEQRMKKQDERILDVMGRLEVIQSRVMAAAAARPPPTVVSQPPAALESVPAQEKSRGVTEPFPAVQQPESQFASRVSRLPVNKAQLDETKMAAIRLLVDAPKNTRQLTDALKMSREHTARMMKELFEMGLVQRNDSTKPFVHQLTDEGRRLLA